MDDNAIRQWNKEGNQYIIERIIENRDSVWLKFYNTNYIWNSNRFMTLVELRYLKIEKIKNK